MINELDDLWLRKPWVYFASCFIFGAACIFIAFYLGYKLHGAL